MNEFTEAYNLPPFSDLFGDSGLSDDALSQMLAVAFDPATPDPGTDLIPDPDTLVADSEDSLGIDLGDLDDGDDGSDNPDTDPVPGLEESSSLIDGPLDPFSPTPTDIPDPLEELSSDPGEDMGGFDGSLGDDPLADF